VLLIQLCTIRIFKGEGNLSKPFFVKFSVPKELVDAAYEALQLASQSGSVRKGTNETTKAVERAQAKLVVIAEDVDPPEVVAHLPLICDERKIPYVFVPSKQKIGSATGIDVPAAAASIVEVGDAAGLVKEISKRLDEVKKQAGSSGSSGE
jgi:large subunit ribosomal protein L7Ae